jgi:prevent-host-death family protein
MADEIPASQARGDFAEVINRAAYGKRRVVLTRRGKKLAAVIPVEDLELLERLEDRVDLDDARKALKERGSLSWEKLKADLKL